MKQAYRDERNDERNDKHDNDDHKKADRYVPPARTSQEQFDRQATHYDQQWNQWSEQSLAWMLEAARPQPDDVVLDVATGTGFTALAFAPQVRSVVGLDVSAGMLAQASRQQTARGLENVAWQQGAAEQMPFADRSFSLVTCRIAPHHFASVAGFLSEAARVLRPGGRLVVTDTCVPDDQPQAAAWQNDVERLRDPSHAANLTPSAWRQQIAASGLQLTRMDGPFADIDITLEDWMVKSGCTPDQAQAVRHAFAAAPPQAVQAFQIEPLPGGDMRFVWLRAAFAAVKSSQA